MKYQLTKEIVSNFETDDLLLLEVKNIILTTGPKTLHSKLKKYDKNYFLKFTPCLQKEKDVKFSQIIYHIFMQLDEIPKCIICGDNAIWPNKEYAFFKSYNRICANKNCYKELSKKLLRENASNEESAKKRLEHAKATFLEKYGTSNPFETNFVKNGRRKKWKENHDEIIEKRIKTNLEKYGCEHGLSNKEIRNKIKETCIKKYGGNTPMSSKEIQDKAKRTCLERYGYEYNTQNVLMRIKQMESAFKKKEFIMPSGKVVICQGYEPQAIKMLLEKFDESDIIVNDKEIENEIGEIWYFNKNEMHRYFPDIYIKSLNKIIEVKSEWTYKINEEVNILKKIACEKLGFLFEFCVI